MKKLILSAMAFISSAFATQATAQNLESQVESILSQMTLEEKVRLSYAQSKFSSPGVARLGVPELYTSDGPHGVRMEINWNDWNHARWTNDYCTAFPALTCLAASWNPELALLYGRMAGEEARYRKKNVLLGPGVNLYRTPLNGRNFEYMGEDPILASMLCAPYIRGLQSNGVACCVKHYALNEQEEWRGHVDVRVSDRALRELYLRPFEAAVKEGGAWSLMGSYNQYLDQHASHNKRLLNEILKQEWGFDGAVISDWGAAHNTEESIFNGLDLEMGSYTNGLTSESKNEYDDYYLGSRYLEKCRKGEVPMDVINDKARRMLRLILRTSPLYNPSSVNPERPYGAINSPEHVAAARRIAQEGIVLLKNSSSLSPALSQGEGTRLLPLTEEKLNAIHNSKLPSLGVTGGGFILVVGENATRSLCAGGGSSELKPRDEVSPLRGIQERYAGVATVEYAQGYVSGPAMYGNVKAIPDSTYDRLRAEAVEKAKNADVVIYVGGLNKNHQQDCEGGDRLSYDLPFHQNELISELLKVNKNTVLVLVSGNAYSMPWEKDAAAIVQSWYLGSEAGHALADVLSGDVCPSGKLPFTFAYALNDYPAHKLGNLAYPGVHPNQLPQPFGGEAGKPLKSADLLKAALSGWKGIATTAKAEGRHGDETEVYAEDILLGYRWFDYFKTKPRYPFGYGLSYTTFAYGKPQIAGDKVTVTVRNTGTVAGSEIVQFYVGDDKASVVRPVKELKHFAKITLAPGEEKEVSYTIKAKDLEFYDEVSQQWKSEPGSFTVYVGASSADIKGKVKWRN